MGQPLLPVLPGNLIVAGHPPAELAHHPLPGHRLLVIEPGIVLVNGKYALEVLLHGKFHVLHNGPGMPAFRLQQGSIEAEPGAGDDPWQVHIGPGLAEQVHTEPVHAVPLGNQVVEGIQGQPVSHHQPGSPSEAAVQGRQEPPVRHIVRIEDHNMAEGPAIPLADERDAPTEHRPFSGTGAFLPFQHRHMGIPPAHLRGSVLTVVRQQEHPVQVPGIVLVFQALEQFPHHIGFIVGADQDGEPAGFSRHRFLFPPGQKAHEYRAAGPEKGHHQQQLDDEGQSIHHGRSLIQRSG